MAQSPEGAKLAKKFKGIVKFDVNGRNWVLDMKSSNPRVVEGDESAAGIKKADLVIRVSDEDFQALASGSLNPQQAFMKGKLKLKGNMGLAMKFNTVLKATKSRFQSRL